MILVDTSVWIDHLRTVEPGLAKGLSSGQVFMHPMVVGELACGNLPERTDTLKDLEALPTINALDHSTVLSYIESLNLMGRGIGFVDAHLISSVLENKPTLLWTRDKRLKTIAEDLGIAFSESHTRGG